MELYSEPIRYVSQYDQISGNFLGLRTFGMEFCYCISLTVWHGKQDSTFKKKVAVEDKKQISDLRRKGKKLSSIKLGKRVST